MSWRLSAPALATVLLLSACGNAQSPAGSTPASTTPSASAASTEASPSPASVVFAWPDGEAPTVTRELTGIDERYINPGAVIEHDRELHMYANVFTGWPGRVQVPHLVSTDGVTWSLAEPEPVLTSDDVPFAMPGADVSTGFVADDGTWVLIFESVNTIGPWALGRATAPGPDGPWTVVAEPILEGGPDGSWDAGGLSWPSVVRLGDGWAMYYTALDRPRGNGVIGMATSTDGATWTKRDEPVLVPEAEWEGRGLDRPRVAPTPDGTFVMVYAGAQLTDRGVAFSADGQTWERDGDAPAITAEDFPITGRAWDAALLQRNGVLTYYLEIGSASGTGGTQVYRATATLAEEGA
jgi:predicted GH43/DUF377 family glycosyl hydrolase